jgi:hypothetical protein
MKPFQSAPNDDAPERCNPARSRPSCSAAARVGSPGSIHSVAIIEGSATMTSGTGAPAAPSHLRPDASAVKMPAGASPEVHVLAKTEVPSSSVSRLAVDTLLPPTGVSRRRW